MFFCCHQHDYPPDPEYSSQALKHLRVESRMDVWTDATSSTLLASTPTDIHIGEGMITQPYCRGPWVIACWARLDDPRQLAHLLQWEGPLPEDALLLAHAWARWGRDGLHKVYGRFALAAWNTNERSLVCAVDHMASVPLFYVATSRVWAASPVRASLLALRDVPKHIDAEALATLVESRIPAGELWRGLAFVPEGHCVTFRSRCAPRIERWWRPLAQPMVFFRDARDYTPLLKETFRSAVNAIIRRVETPLASCLSGGLDSSLATAVAATEEPSRVLHAFTSAPGTGFTFPELTGSHWDADETALTTELARKYPNIEHHIVRPDLDVCLLDVLRESHRYSWNPVRNAANHRWMGDILQQARNRGARLLITGGKGNAILSYSGMDGVGRLLRRGLFAQAWPFLKSQRTQPRTLLKNVATALGWNGALRTRPRQSVASHLLAPRWRSAQSSKSVAGRLRTSWERRVDFALTPRRPYAQDAYQQFGVLVEDPFFDRALTELVLTLPPEAYLWNGYPRAQARLLGEDIVPEGIRWRTRRGAQAPDEGHWVVAQADRYRSEWAALRELPHVGEILDIDAMDRQVEMATVGSKRVEVASLHRALHVALFLQDAHAHWGGTPIAPDAHSSTEEDPAARAALTPLLEQA